MKYLSIRYGQRKRFSDKEMCHKWVTGIFMHLEGYLCFSASRYCIRESKGPSEAEAYSARGIHLWT